MGVEIVTSGGAAVPIHTTSPAAVDAVEALTLKAILAELPEPSLREMLGAKHANLSASVSPLALHRAMAAHRAGAR